MLTIHLESESIDPDDGKKCLDDIISPTDDTHFLFPISSTLRSKYIIGHMMVKFGKMVFVDLAGSERLKESKATGMTMTETGNMFSILWTILFFRFERPLTLIYFNIVYFALKYFFRCHK